MEKVKRGASDRVRRDLSEASSLLLSIRTGLLEKCQEGKFDHDDQLLLVATEKCGALTDRCLMAFGDAPVVGNAEDWGNCRQW